MKDSERKQPNWLVFVDKAPDDGQLLRMMVLNPFNGAMSTLVNTPIEADPTVLTTQPAALNVAREH
jgi:hypothetical protein